MLPAQLFFNDICFLFSACILKVPPLPRPLAQVEISERWLASHQITPLPSLSLGPFSTSQVSAHEIYLSFICFPQYSPLPPSPRYHGLSLTYTTTCTHRTPVLVPPPPPKPQRPPLGKIGLVGEACRCTSFHDRSQLHESVSTLYLYPSLNTHPASANPTRETCTSLDSARINLGHLQFSISHRDRYQRTRPFFSLKPSPNVETCRKTRACPQHWNTTAIASSSSSC